MNILVCIKQVPDTTEIRIDPVTHNLIRADVPSIVNPYDAYALEMAVRLKEKQGGQVTVISMGPMQAQTALKTCLATGADKAFLVCDKAFAGSDTLATGYILAKTVEYLEKQCTPFNLILCGKQAIDGDTAQVGPQLAENLNLPQITCVADQPEIINGELQVKKEADTGYELVASKLPVLLTVTKPPFEARLPSLKSKLAASRADITSITAQDLAIPPEKCGLKGSPTRVKKTYTLPQNKNSILVTGSTPKEQAANLLQMLDKQGIL